MANGRGGSRPQSHIEAEWSPKRPFWVAYDRQKDFVDGRRVTFSLVSMLHRIWPCIAVGAASLSSLALSSLAASAPDAAGTEFFEKHIRPVLVERCYKCHSAKAEKLKGGLRLDTRDDLLKGGDSGPVIVPGEPEKSLLIKAVRYMDENLQMPPAKNGGGKLSHEKIEDLIAWVKMGAPDPRTGEIQNSKFKIQNSQHWAFQPVRELPLPTVKNKRLVQTPVDNFLLAKLEEKGLTFSPRADKRTLIRRATYDLLGLPPTPEEVWAFEKDKSPDAFAKLLDRLLVSPRYGERWGRYWLDVARYADTKGYVFEEERKYPYSYTYRDWVIHAFNEDLPYDQFLVQQIAADLLPLADDKRALAALGFLTLGRRFLNNAPDIIDDRIDVMTRGTMALTVGCARCHDHKFDPIPTRDYYSLYGVFASCNEPVEEPLLGAIPNAKEYAEYEGEKKKRADELKEYRAARDEEARTRVREEVGDYLLLLHDTEAADEGRNEGLARERKLEPAAMRHFRVAAKEWGREGDAIFTPWFAFAALNSSNFAAHAKELSAKFASGTNGTHRLNAHVAKLFAPEKPPATLKDVAAAYNGLFASVNKEWRELQTNSPAATCLANADREALRQVLYGPETPAMKLDADELHRLFATPVQQKLRALKRKIDELDATHPGAPPRAMALVDNSTPTNPHIFKRGNPNTPGDEVPRQFLEIVAGPDRKPFTKGSGRLEMAQAIASRDNPLTARVWVNRVWMYHFGAPLVRTPSDFGMRSDPPTNPQLLDYLAFAFTAPRDSQLSTLNSEPGLGWATKKLHRLIMLSFAYQQASDDNPKAAKVDPGNTLLWRQNRRRLDFEAMRDTLLAASGRIDFTAGGRAVEITTEPFSTRRTVYGFVERQNLPGLFRTFDFASPDTTSPQRFSTTVPQQALFLMNSPFVVEQARNMLDRAEVKSATSDEQKIRRLYEIAFEREPDADEIRLGKKFIGGQRREDLTVEPPVWSYGYGKFDEETKQVNSFTALPHWTGYAWQGGTNLPDAKLGWVLLTADGGHVGNDRNHAAIRRWRAPRDGTIDIRSELNHPSDKGDGVRARIVSSRLGLLGECIAQNGRTFVRLDRIEVRRGDFIDFVADCRQSVEFDSFHWAPTVQFAGGTGKLKLDEVREWDAKADFGGPQRAPEKHPLNAWEKYAQVLLLANELMFVD
jgi:hypothetical protein